MTTSTFDRWLLGTGGLAALLVVAGLLTFWNTRRLHEDAGWVAHTHEVMDALEEVNSRLREAETAQRTYLIVGGDGIPSDFAAHIDAAKQKVGTVKVLTEDNPEQQARIPDIEKRIEELEKLWNHTMTVRQTRNFDEAKKIVTQGKSRAKMAELQGKLRRMDAAEQALLRNRSEKREHTYHWALVTGLLSGLASVAGVAAFMVLLRRHLAARAAAVIAEQGERLEKDNVSRLLAARLMASIVESSDDAIISKSLDGIIQSWNAAAERLFGYSAEQAVGRHISLIIPADRAAEEDRIIARLKAGQRVQHCETVRLRSDGQPILVSLTISPIKDETGRVIGASKIARDITRQRQAEERERLLLAEAAAANAKFRAFFEQGALFAGIMSVDGVILEPNRLSWEGCGFTREQIIGKPFWQGPWWTPSPALMERIKTASAQAAAGRIFRAEMPYFVADGGERIVDITILPIKDEEGRVLFLAPTGTDITDRKRAEADRRRLEDDLRKLAADLSEASRRKDEFLATLAHELRNPLAPIRNALQIIRLSTDGVTGEKARMLMERQLEQMVRLVDDLLDVSRITRGRLELRKERVLLSAVVGSAVEISRPTIDHMGHELTIALPKQTIVLDADLTRLAQVFSNLLNNSAKYMDRGGRIRLIAERQGSDVVVSVKDSGIGIAADQLPRLFEMFAQVEHALERSQGGLGIGLTLVKRLVEMHGGRIEARSEGLGKGAEFVVRLPVVVDASEPQAPSAKDAPAAPKSALRILIVDDNRDSADSLAMLLRLMGNDTRTAYDGQAGVAAAEEFRPAVMLLDIGLPKLNGYEACRRIRGQSWGESIVLIAVTGWGQEEDRRLSHEAGFDRHMVKPVDPQELLKAITSVGKLPAK